MKKTKKLEHWKIIAAYLVIYDVIAVNASYLFGLLLRFDLHYSAIPKEDLSAFFKFAPFYTVFCLVIFCVLKLYNSLWRFASFSELNRILAANVIAFLFHITGMTIFCRALARFWVFLMAVASR